tara:strand:- start:761 stop:934 length:174 start_codon:yes stop_codon:yes gene_type:complete
MKLELEEILRMAEFELWNSCLQVSTDTPQVIVKELQSAHNHIIEAMKILGITEMVKE